jgi:hypothetical protein
MSTAFFRSKEALAFVNHLTSTLGSLSFSGNPEYTSGGTTQRVNAWCEQYGLAPSKRIQAVRNDFRKRGAPPVTMHTSAFLKEVDNLYMTIRPKRAGLGGEEVVRAQVLDAFVCSRRTSDLCMILETDVELDTRVVTGVRDWACELLIAYNLMVGSIVGDAAFMGTGWGVAGRAAAKGLLEEAVVAFDAVALIMESLTNRLSNLAHAKGEANVEVAQSGIRQLEASSIAAERLLKHAESALWLVASGLSYDGEGLRAEGFRARAEARRAIAKDALAFVGGNFASGLRNAGGRTVPAATECLLVESLASLLDPACSEALSAGEGGAGFCFPPKHVSSLLTLFLVGSEDEIIAPKLCLVVYAVMDMSLDGALTAGPESLEKAATAFSFARRYAQAVALEDRFLDALTALWLLDAGVQLGKAVNLLLRPNVVLEGTLVMNVVRALADSRVRASEAFHYLTAARPPLRNKEDAALVIRIYLQNGLWQHAFDEQRRICRGGERGVPVWLAGVPAPETKALRRMLLNMIFDWFFVAHRELVGHVIALPLLEYEEVIFVQYMVNATQDDPRDVTWMTLLVHYYLKRSQVHAAGKVDAAHRSILQTLGEGVQLLERPDMKARALLIKGHLETLPEISLKTAEVEFQHAYRAGWDNEVFRSAYAGFEPQL